MPPQYVFSLVGGQYFRTRAIGFLEESESDELDAKGVYEGLRISKRQLVDSRFKHWLDGQVFDKYFHGFTGKYDKCYVFKWEDRRIPQRFYGFLCHPRPESYPGFQLCVLVYFATKADVMDYTILDRINALIDNPFVKEAIAGTYPELQRKIPWTQ